MKIGSGPAAVTPSFLQEKETLLAFIYHCLPLADGKVAKGAGEPEDLPNNMSHDLVGKVVTISQLCRIKKGYPQAESSVWGFFY